MTHEREALGRVIKGELEDMGLIRFGEVITNEILALADMQELRFYKIGDDTYFMEF